MTYHVFVDNSNIWIEGKYWSAVKEGKANNINDAHDRKIQNNNWKIDFGKLLSTLVNDKLDEVEHAILLGSKPTDKDSLWKAAKTNGFEVEALERNVANKEKKVDATLLTKITKTLFRESSKGDVFVLALGDADYVPAIQAVKEEGCIAKVVFWPNISAELKSEADEFVNLWEYIEKITFGN